MNQNCDSLGIRIGPLLSRTHSESESSRFLRGSRRGRWEIDAFSMLNCLLRALQRRGGGERERERERGERDARYVEIDHQIRGGGRERRGERKAVSC